MNRAKPLIVIVALVAVGVAWTSHLSTADVAEPAARQGCGPDIAMIPFSVDGIREGEYVLLTESAVLTLGSPGAAIIDARLRWWNSAPDDPECELTLERIGSGEGELVIDYEEQLEGGEKPLCRFTLGGAWPVEPGEYVVRLWARAYSSSTPGPSVDGWLRLQIFGCENGLCLPGDLDKDGDVDLNGFATFAVNYTG